MSEVYNIKRIQPRSRHLFSLILHNQKYQSILVVCKEWGFGVTDESKYKKVDLSIIEVVLTRIEDFVLKYN